MVNMTYNYRYRAFHATHSRCPCTTRRRRSRLLPHQAAGLALQDLQWIRFSPEQSAPANIIWVYVYAGVHLRTKSAPPVPSPVALRVLWDDLT